MRARRILPIALAALATASAARAQTIHRVDDSASGANDGTSWQDAFETLPAAFAVALPGDQIWVAEGTYRATEGLDRDAFLTVACDVYGGFDGTEANLAQRAGLFDTTVLSGDLLGDDGPNFANRDDNSRRTLYVPGASIVDGLTIRGMHNPDKVARFSAGDVTVRNCRFMDNQGSYGGACSLQGGNPTFEDCRFVGNHGAKDAGAIAGTASPSAWVQCVRCEFLDNRGINGPGACEVRGSFIECEFRNNEGYWGGALASPGNYRIEVERCHFEGNYAWSGGAIRDRADVRDCTFSDNSANRGGAIDGAELVVTGCDFEGNTAAEGGAVSVRTTHVDPDFPCLVADSRFVANTATRGGALRGFWNGMQLTVQDCAFEANAAEVGGAIDLDDPFSNAAILRSDFVGNVASVAGGAVSSSMGCALVECRFEGNASAGEGGGVRLVESWLPHRILLCRFLGNAAGGVGGGGLWAGPNVPGLEMLGCELAGNRADGASGGGGGAWLDPAAGPIRVVNCTFWENTALGAGLGGGGLAGDPTEVANTIFWRNRDDTGDGFPAQVVDTDLGDGRFPLVHCAVSGWDGSWKPGSGNHGGDPLFLDPAGPDGVPGTADDDLRLGPGSACIDVASRAAYVLSGPTGPAPGPGVDLFGAQRFIDALACGEAAPPDGILDLGARERATVDGENVLCSGAASSLGVPAELEAPCGVSVAGGPFVLRAAPVPPETGVFLASLGHGAKPFGDGTLCLAPPLVRLAAVAAVGGALETTLDPTGPPYDHLLVPGSVWYVQVLYRDTAAGGAGFNLSSAVTVVVRP